MKQIDIYSGGEPISRVAFGEPEAGIVEDCNSICSLLPPDSQVFAVVDRKAFNTSGFVSGLTGMLEKNGAHIYMLDAKEETKTMDTVMGLCSWLMDSGADRNAFVLAAGGGITTDMAGFAASIYKRGIRFAYVPTTLLAQVDAAVGGKTGVNFDKYKNMLGVIRQPEFTFVSSRALCTLPKRDFLSGASEMIKSFVIGDAGNYAEAVAFLKELHETSQEGPSRTDCAVSGMGMRRLTDMVASAIAVKAGIVSRDQYEEGERRKLNLGHTFAHAVETLARRKCMDVTHGEAVSIGMVLAARLGVRLGVSEPCFADCFEADVKLCGLAADCPFDISEMAPVMMKDKKAEGGKIHFVVPRSIGDVTIVDLTADEACTLLG